MFLCVTGKHSSSFQLFVNLVILTMFFCSLTAGFTTWHTFQKRFELSFFLHQIRWWCLCLGDKWHRWLFFFWCPRRLGQNQQATLCTDGQGQGREWTFSWGVWFVATVPKFDDPVCSICSPTAGSASDSQHHRPILNTCSAISFWGCRCL
jgi:hypothetical protein